ncbi:MAG TPA: calcium/sodium antiporter [Chitinispirillaceae bacterium]|nr:calcium/sodium antiporter [Chitinispirillaceae bacterium]
MISFFFILLGFVLLYFGAEWLVKGASSLALKAGISPLIVGLTVVAFGTSAPELVVSTLSSLRGAGDLALGNVIGSNIFNIAVILGIASIIAPMKIHQQVLKIDLPVMIVATGLLMVFLSDFRISRVEGVFLTAGIVAYLLWSSYLARKGKQDVELPENGNLKYHLDIILSVGGIILLVLGSHFLVSGAVTLARMWGISEAIIGLTIVATGTSLPELATSIVAGIKKEADIAIGNIIGSNIFNILAILGISSIIAPIQSKGITTYDLLFTVISVLILTLFLFGKKLLRRWHGMVLLCLYGIYIVVIWPR